MHLIKDVGNPQLRLRHESLLFTSNVGSLFHAVMYVDTTLNLTRRRNIGKLVIVFVTYF